MPSLQVHPRYRFVGDYLAFVKEMFARTAAGDRVLIDWAADPVNAVAWRAQFRTALNLRINAKGGITPRGRYCPPDLRSSANFSGFVRDQIRLRDIRRRVRVYQFETRAVRDRFSHLLSRDDD